MRKWIKQKGIDFLKNSQGKPFREHAFLFVMTRHLARLGVDSFLITKGKHIVTQKGLNAGIAFLNKVRRLHGGDYSVVPNIMMRLSSDDEKKRLLRLYPGIMEREVELRGDSDVFNWLMESGEISLEDTQLREYVNKRFEWARNKHLGTYKSRNIKFNRSKALEVLLELQELFRARGKRFFLSSGTLLGAIRENGFIASDYDIDLGVFPEEITVEEATDIISRGGFSIQLVEPYLIAFRHEKTGINIEIFFYDLQQGRRHCRTEIHHWWYRNFDMVPYELQGHTFLVPSNVERHLEENFGNWRSKVLFYDFSYDCPNRTYAYNLESILYLFDRTNRAYARGWRYYADNGAQALRDYFDIDYTQYLPRKINVKSIPSPIYKHAIKKKSVVICVGIFSIINSETLYFLEKCRSQGNHLIAALLSGEFLEKSGIGRAGARDRDRRTCLLALECVDDVVVVESPDDLKNLMRMARPVQVSYENEKISGALPPLATHPKPQPPSRGKWPRTS